MSLNLCGSEGHITPKQNHSELTTAVAPKCESCKELPKVLLNILNILDLAVLSTLDGYLARKDMI